MFDGKAFGAEVVDIVKGFITKALHDIKIDVAGLIQRVDDLELREPIKGKDGARGEPGDPGKDGCDGLPGDDGQDADPELVAQHVIAKLNAIIDRTGSLVLTIDGTQHNLGTIVGKDGANGRDGVSGTDGQDGVDGAPGKDGEPGKNGKDADPLLVREMVLRELAELPKPLDGKDGINGKDGKDGLNGADGKDAAPITTEEIRLAIVEYFKCNPIRNGEDGINGKDADPEAIERMVVEAVSKLQPKDGANGLNGKDGKDADPEEIADLVSKAVTSAVDALPKAKEPIGFSSSLIDKDGNLVLTRTDGMVCEIGRIVGANGLNGADGKDADPATIERMIEDRISIALEDLDNRPQQPDLTIPDDLIDEIAKAAAYLAESPTIAQRSGSRITRTIRTRRDENGYLVGDVIERGM